MNARSRTIIIALLFFLIASVPLYSATYPLDRNTVNSFDKLTMQPYSKPLTTVSKITTAAALATPAVLVCAPSSDYLKIGIMYAETVALTFGAKELIKHVVFRERPYLYFEGYPEEGVTSGDCNRSFLSGHTSLSFAGASFTSYVFSKYCPESKWRIPVIAASYGLATATAALRVASGNHFTTDVIAGALLGAAIGYAVPALHTLLAEKNVEASVSPFGLVFKIGL